jgi:hypothetical protein
MATDTQAALKQVEAELAANAAQFKQEAPEQYAKMTRVLEAMKKAPPGKPQSDEVKRLVVDLLRWQFDAQRREFEALRASMAERAKSSGDPAFAKAAVAYGEVVKLLEQAKLSDFPPSAKAQAALDEASRRVKKAFEEASDAASRSTLDIPLRTIRQPIVSSSGVALKAVEPPPRAAAGAASAPVKPPPPSAPKKAPAGGQVSAPPPRPSGPIRELGSSDGPPRSGKAPPRKK